MNIMQAIQKGLKKGKKIKRSIWETTYVGMSAHGKVYMSGSIDAMKITADDLLADDWEII